MSEEADELRNHIEALEANLLVIEREKERTQDASLIRAFESTLTVERQNLKNSRRDLEQQEKYDEMDEFSESPVGRLLWLTSQAMQYDHYGEDALQVWAELQKLLAEEGLKLEVTRVDEQPR